MSKIVMIGSPDEKKPSFLHKYMTLENAIKTLSEQKLWFSRPESWDDPYEQAYQKLESKWESHKGRLFCLCLTTGKTSEAYWNRYSTSQVAEITLDYNVLKEILSRRNDEGTVYMGHVSYFDNEPNSELPNFEKLIERIGSQSDENISRFIKTLFLKRRNFQYEKEFRIVVELNNPKKEDGISISFNGERANLVKSLILSPRMSKANAAYYKKYLSQSLGIMNVKHSMLYTDPFKPR